MKQQTAIDSRTGTCQTPTAMPVMAPPPGIALSYTEALVDPGGVFRNPADVVEHPWFTREEKRTVLLSWARDELVLEHMANRSLPELKPRSRIDAVIEALAQFDLNAAAEYRAAVSAIGAHELRPKARRA
ncbi:hypothetical protein [Microvirga sp. CF3016]|uniref:hypothetical protein n=1 Tax=Microvirga sp. CF3016 TaxID=3110181 RepID=UPI002E780E29|nr:hypothetical protein [Microvirga sp. CF3016]MEE1612982.1 hypothetical protein [Microvirga sp. CF3016]